MKATDNNNNNNKIIHRRMNLCLYGRPSVQTYACHIAIHQRAVAATAVVAADVENRRGPFELDANQGITYT